MNKQTAATTVPPTSVGSSFSIHQRGKVLKQPNANQSNNLLPSGSDQGTHKLGSKNANSANVSASHLPPYRHSSAAGGKNQSNGGDMTRSQNNRDSSSDGDDRGSLDVLGAVKGEGYGKDDLNLKERIGGGVKVKRNLDIVDTIYDKTERRTLHQINKLKFIDDQGLQHRLREKTLGEENLEKIEHNVIDQFAKDQNFAKFNNVTDIRNKAFVTEESKMNQEKLKGKFDLIINHDLKMNKKIEMYANDNLVYHLHKGRNFLFKLKKAEEQRIIEKKEKEIQDRAKAQEEELKKQHEHEQELLRKQQDAYNEKMAKDLKELGQAPVEVVTQALPTPPEEKKQTSTNFNIRYQNKKLAHIQSKLLSLPKTFVQSTKHQDQVRDHYRYNMITNKILSSSLEGRPYNKAGLPLQISSSKQSRYLMSGLQSPNYQSGGLNQALSSMRETPRNQDIKIEDDNDNSTVLLRLPLVQSEHRSSMGRFASNQRMSTGGDQLQQNLVNRFHRTHYNKCFFQYNKEAVQAITEIEKRNQHSQQQQSVMSNNAAAETPSQPDNQKKNSKQTDQIKSSIRALAEICNRTNRQTIQSLQNLQINMDDERLKEKNFGVVFNLLRELDGADGGIVESLFKYKIEDRLEFEEEAKVITKQYKMGAFDPSKDISRFEQKQRFKKRKELLRSQAQRID